MKTFPGYRGVLVYFFLVYLASTLLLLLLDVIGLHQILPVIRLSVGIVVQRQAININGRLCPLLSNAVDAKAVMLLGRVQSLPA